MQDKRPRPGRYQMLERKEGLGVGENTKKESELSDVRGKGAERFSSES